MDIPLFYNADLLAAGHGGSTAYVSWNPARHPHMVISGSTGSGKSYAVKIILGRLATHLRAGTTHAIVCDYKTQDFTFLSGLPGVYFFNNCMDGLQTFYKRFEARQSGLDPSKDFHILVFSEWGACLSMMEKREAEDAKRLLGTLLMLGRSYNFHVIVDIQRPDVTWLSSRDNFSIFVTLGSMSPEAMQMGFSNFREQIRPAGRGAGYMTDGASLTRIVVPEVQRPRKLEEAISNLFIAP